MLISGDGKSSSVLAIFASEKNGGQISYQQNSRFFLTSSEGQIYTSLSAALNFLAANKEKQALTAEAVDSLLLVAQLHSTASSLSCLS
jgi:hypothetical protein